jgi:hypothetical protein
MNAAFTTEEFEVTLLTDDDFDISWKIIAESPEQALEKAMRLPNACAGTYSVWDPQDPNGMPLLEHS